MFVFTLALLAVIQLGQAINGKCRALVLGGGSDRGAFQAGAISGLIAYLPAGEATWDVVQGNGIGALNALLVSQYGQGDEASVNNSLTNFWTGFKTSMIYKNWFGGTTIGYYFRNGLYNSAPASSTLKKIFTGSFNRNVIIGITDILRSDYIMMNTSFATNEEMLLGILANLNSKGNFGAINYNNSQFASGEIAFGVDVFSAIQYCRNLNYKDRYITVDIVLVNHAKLESYNAANKNTLQNWSRFNEIQNYHNVFERIVVTKQAAPLVTYRTEIVMPDSIPIGGDEPFDYETKSTLKSMVAAGIATAKAALGK